MKKAFFPLHLASVLFGTSKTAAQIVTDYFAKVDAGEIETVGELLSDEFEAIAPFSPVPLDKQSWKGVGYGFKTAFPDMQHKILLCVDGENAVAVKGIFRGTNTGSYMGNAATGNAVKLPFNAIFELNEQGKITSLSTQFDQKSFEAQLMAGMNPAAVAEALVNGIMNAADAGDANSVITFFAPDAKHYFGGVANTNEELKMRIAGLKAAFPDIHRTLDVLSFSNNIICCKGRLTGTNTGMFMGKPATGNKINVLVLAVYKLNEQGKVTEAWVEMDTATLMGQLKGEVPAS